MRKRWHAPSFLSLATISLFLLAGCGVNKAGFLGQSGSGSSSSSVTITVSGAGSVALGAQSQYAATVTGSSNTAVSWSVNGVTGGGSATGTITGGGLYTAPGASSLGSVTITAASVASPSTSRSLTVALAGGSQPSSAAADVSLALTGPASVELGAAAQFGAVVTGTPNTGVLWSVNGVQGGGDATGTVSATGLYLAPASMPAGAAVTITATSAADGSVSRSVNLALTSAASAGGALGSGITVALSGATAVELEKTAQYSATVSGSSDHDVAWSVDGVAGGDSRVGTISPSGLYQAPSSMPASAKITIAAASEADASVVQSLVVTLSAAAAPPSPTLTLSGASSVMLGGTAQYSAAVSGAAGAGVAWSVDGQQGGDASVGTITSAGRYKAPSAMPAGGKVTITATSTSTSAAASQSMTVTLTAPPPASTLDVSGPASVTLGTTAQYTAQASDGGSGGVTWSVNGVKEGSPANGTISAAGLYTAPSSAPGPGTVTITAAEAANPAVTDSVVVALTAPPSGSPIPAYAISSGDLNPMNSWQWTHDPGTPGSSWGTTTYPYAGVSADNKARQFYMTYSNGAGELYHVSFARDVNATHYVYDTYVYVSDPTQLKNLEMDMNAVMSDGRTVILATQCSGYSGTWEYTLNNNGGFHWKPSNVACDPGKWAAQTWHHIQIASHRDNNGYAYYDWVSVDGQIGYFSNASGFDAAPLGWAVGDLLINFQIDGPGKRSGANTIYTDRLQVWRW